jgi:hypothetical protein
MDGSLDLEEVCPTESQIRCIYDLDTNQFFRKRFLFDLNEDMHCQGHFILLFCDNVPLHKYNPGNYPHVRVEFLAPNLTSRIQPMDGGIYNCWRQVGLVPSDNFPPMPEAFCPAFRGCMHPPQPVWYEPEVMALYPEFQQALTLFDFDLQTKHYWTDQEIVNPILAEREEGFPIKEEEEEYDLDDFYYYHTEHT